MGRMKVLPLPCQMTANERLLKSIELSEKLREREQIEAEKKHANEEFKERLTANGAEVSALSNEVRTGNETRPIECTESPRYADMMVDLIRTDTGEVVSSRAMHPDERQAALGLDDREAHSL